MHFYIKKKRLLVGTIVTFAIIITALFIEQKNLFTSQTELSYLTQNTMSFSQLSVFFKNLAQKKGAGYAFDILGKAKLPPNIDLHLLGHIVGDELYKQQGLNGIKLCTNEFRNACSHSIVVGLFNQKGETALNDIANICREAPGGKGAYTMCFHGLGHGILAYTEYDLPKTVDICKKTATPQYQNREYIECVGGSIMEIVGGGFHNRELFLKQQKKYLLKADPLTPCSSQFIAKEVQPICYTYLTPQLFKTAGANIARPDEKYYQKAFSFCDRLLESEKENRSACFAGFGKEFVVLAKDRDIRKESLAKFKDRELLKIIDWCGLSLDRDGVRQCLLSAVNSLYWGGENDFRVAIRFCSLIENETDKDTCFNNLFSAFDYYNTDKNQAASFCSSLPTDYQKTCSEKLPIQKP